MLLGGPLLSKLRGDFSGCFPAPQSLQGVLRGPALVWRSKLRLGVAYPRDKENRTAG